MGGGRSLYSGEQAESDSEGEDDNGFPEERSQQKRRGCKPSTDLMGRSGSPPDMDWQEPVGLKRGSPSGGTTSGAAHRPASAARGEHCTPAGRGTGKPAWERLRGLPGQGRGARGWPKGWDPGRRFQEAGKETEVTTLQGDESEDEARLFGLREVDGEGSAEEDGAFPSSAGKDGKDSADEGVPPPPEVHHRR